VNYRAYPGHNTAFYETTSAVADVVNLAISLGRPILVEGEAGCGKTQLAHSISSELGLGRPTVLRIKSTTQAKDLLYRFDALRRLQESQNPKLAARASFVYPYISLQPLGRAIQAGQPGVVLLDEVDKADIDFPNDLLDVLDEFTFDIEDLPDEESEQCARERGFSRTVSSVRDLRPIVVITSNREKQLPEAFLRRCLYLELVFPSDEVLLTTIVRKNIGVDPERLSEELVQIAVRKFIEVRGKAIAIGADQKPPATSELIDWIKVLHWRGQESEEIAKSDLRPPYWEMLFKTKTDLHAYKAQTTDVRIP
jgi:MoxR-like ATPase